MNSKRYVRMGRGRAVAFLLALLSFGLCKAQDLKSHNFEVAKQLDIFNTIYKDLDMMYVDTLNPKYVVGNAIKYMLAGLDPYTVYYPEDDAKELKYMITGKYAGIGSVIRYNRKLGVIQIEEPYADMPAAKAGLQRGDIIVSIDDSLMTDKTTDQVSNLLRGEAGTSFALKVLRPDALSPKAPKKGSKLPSGKMLTMKITRQAIQTPTVPYYGLQAGGIGYIHLSSFTEDCSKDVRRALIDLKQQGAKSLVFDLRENGGGSLAEAVNIVNLFVPKGLQIVNTKGKLARVNTEYKTLVEPLDTLMPIVVLVNRNTASASEVTSGALQDLDRAVIVGTRTYGKGLVQMPMQLPYNTNFKLTTSKYFIPSGRCIQALNYRHGAHGGYVEHIPDSLTHVFHTKGGREVRDGGGIKPDVEVHADTMANISFYLMQSATDSTEVLLDYEMAYVQSHPTVAAPDVFEITDADFDDFKQRVLKSNFKYDRESLRAFERLKELARLEGYYDEAEEAFDVLGSKLTHNMERDLEKSRDELKNQIAIDLMTHYYFQGGALHYSLRHDRQMAEAVRLLNTPEEYRRILGQGK